MEDVRETAGFRRETDEVVAKDMAERLHSSYEKGGKRKIEEVLPSGNVLAQFVTVDGEPTGPQLDVPLHTTPEQLQELINHLLSNDEKMPYNFYVNEGEVRKSLAHIATSDQEVNLEKVMQIVYQPQALFRVRAVTRCSGTLTGHTGAILHTSFSPDGQLLATGSEDTNLRVWDVHTKTPIFTLKGHKNWIQATAWSPTGDWLASASCDGDLRVWSMKGAKKRSDEEKITSRQLKGHKDYISSLAWQPMHRDAECRLLASAGKDGKIRIWDVMSGKIVKSLSGHTSAVNAIVWGGQGLLYSGSSDTYVKVWDPEKGILVRQMKHAHRVNSLAVHTFHALRTGHRDPTPGAAKLTTLDAQHEKAVERYQQVRGTGERMVTGSDDHTMYLWHPETSNKPVERMLGHQQPINNVAYSPDGAYIASACYDKSVRLWDGRSGKFIATLRGHVQKVYQVCFSADSRLLLSSSADSTSKIWDVSTRKLKCDLPGHQDEVYATDWSPDGARVATGSKDKTVKIWTY